MKMSHTVPSKYLERFDKYSSCYLVLGHLIGKDKEYTDFFAQSKKYKYLDNSAYELGASIDDKELIDKTYLINANALVLPDVFMKGKDTIERTKIFLDKFKGVHLDFDLVVVPQGSTPEEYLECAEELIKLPNIKTLGISFLVVAKCFSCVTQTNERDVLSNRPLVVGMVWQLMRKQGKQLNIHLLGIGNPIELSCYGTKGFIVSCDSSVGYALAKEKLEVGKFGARREKFNKLNFEDKDTSDDTLSLAEHNMRTINSFI